MSPCDKNMACFALNQAAKRAIQHDSGQTGISMPFNGMSSIRAHWIWDINHSGLIRAHITPRPPSLSHYSQPSSLVCQLGRWMTVSHGTPACCSAPSGFSSARWCWPGASARRPSTYPETGGERVEEEEQEQDGKRSGRALAGRQDSFQQQDSHQHIGYAWLNGMWDNTTYTQEKMREGVNCLHLC